MESRNDNCVLIVYRPLIGTKKFPCKGEMAARAMHRALFDQGAFKHPLSTSKIIFTDEVKVII